MPSNFRKKVHKLKELPPGTERDWFVAYSEATKLIEKLNADNRYLNEILDWCSVRMRNDVAKGTLHAKRYDPSQRKSEVQALEKKQDASKAVKKEKPPPAPSPADDLPPDTAAFLLTIGAEDVALDKKSFEHMAILRAKGAFVVEGVDRRLRMPLQLSVVGLAMRDDVQARQGT